MSLTIIKYHKTPEGLVPITTSVECRTKEQTQAQQIVKVHTCMQMYTNTCEHRWHHPQNPQKSVWQHSEHMVN